MRVINFKKKLPECNHSMYGANGGKQTLPVINKLSKRDNAA